MAFSTGVVIGAQNLLTALSTFMTSNGWTLHHTINSNDLVFFSSGTDGNQNNYIRVTNEARLIDYDDQVTGFTVGQTLTGTTSGATGVILANANGGTTGTLSLIDVSGKFLDNEYLSDGAGGYATANRSEEHTSELQSPYVISYAAFFF